MAPYHFALSYNGHGSGICSYITHTCEVQSAMSQTTLMFPYTQQISISYSQIQT